MKSTTPHLGLALAMTAILHVHTRAATVSWIGGSGQWTTAANWSTGSLPGPNDDVVIDVPDDVTITLASGQQRVKSLFCDESFTHTGGYLTVSNTFQVNQLCTLSSRLIGATVLPGTNGQPVVAAGATLDGVTLRANVNVASGALFVENGLTLLDGARVTLGTSSSAAGIQFYDSTPTLAGNGEIVLGSSAGNSYFIIAESGTILTVAPGVTVHGQGRIDAVTGAKLINLGTIQVDEPGQALRLGSASVVGTRSFTNRGNINALNGATFSLTNVVWANEGTITASNATVYLGGSFTTDGLGDFRRTEGRVILSGALDNAGRTLAFDATTGSWEINPGGWITGGTITAADGATLLANGGTLSGVTLGANLTLTNDLYIAEGLTLVDGAKITLAPAAKSVWLYCRSGVQTLGGTGEVVLASHPTYSSSFYLSASGVTELTIGPDVTVRGGGYISGSGTLNNLGILRSDVQGRVLSLAHSSLTNNGTIETWNGGALRVVQPYHQTSGQTLLNGGSLTNEVGGNKHPLMIHGGTLAGGGLITAGAYCAGRLRPGLAPGVLRIGQNYTQAMSGVLELRLAGLTPGTEYDRLQVAQTAWLDGTVHVALTNGFYPPARSQFTFLTCAQRSNTFATLLYPSNAVGMQLVHSPTSAVVEVVNVRPVIAYVGMPSADEEALLTLPITATDDDLPAQTLTYALTNSPPAASIDPATGVISWMPTEADGPGTNSFTVLVTDNGTPNLTVSRTFQVTVNEINTAPMLTLPPDTPINELTSLGLAASATDADLPANTWTFALVSGPQGLAVSPIGEIAWTPAEAQGPGSHLVTVRVTDQNPDAVNEQQLSVTNSFAVTVREVNQPPVLTAPQDQVLLEETPLSVSALATDSDEPANALTFALLTAPEGMSLNAQTGLITWTPTEAQGSNRFTVILKVSDASPEAVNEQQFSVTNQFTVTVLESNRPPVLTPPAIQTMDEETPLVASASATDPDAPANGLTFALLAAPDGMAIEPVTGQITWTPTEAQGPNSFTISVVVSDHNPDAVNAQQLSATNSFAVTVNEVNRAPAIAPLADETLHAGTLLSLQASATDGDLPANMLTFELLTGPSGFSVSTNGGIAWPVTLDRAGTTNPVQLRMLDDGSPRLSTTQNFNVVVVSALVLETPQITADGVTLAWPSILYRTYRVQFAPNLQPDTWVDLPGDIVADGLSSTKLDNAHTGVATRFYRVLLRPVNP